MAVDEAWLNRQLEGINRSMRELPPSVAASFAPVVANLQQTIEDTIAATYYTKTQTDARIASPGSIAPSSVAASGNVSAAGQVVSAGPLKSPGSYAYSVHVGSWVAGWIDSDGTVGTSPSSSLVKMGLTQMTADDARKLLSLTPYWGRYVWDTDDVSPRVFFLAEDVQAAGFGPDVVPVVMDAPLAMLMPDGSPVTDSEGSAVVIPVGAAFAVNYSQIVVPLVAAYHDAAATVLAMQAAITDLTARMTALESKES